MTLLLALLLPAQAGDPEASYMRLRTRLTSDFVHVGDAQGDSIPAGWRDDRIGLAKWADATIALGWYLGVLGTEWHLRHLDGESTADTEAELALALGAMERLDRVAETGFPEPCTSSQALNGFFVRDDVPADYVDRFEGLLTLQSDWIDGPYLKEESQDQVHHVGMGLALVKRFVPPEVVVDGRALGPWAAEQGVRILEWVEAGDWLIRNPACDDKLVARGESAGPLAPGLAGVYRFLTDGEGDLPSAAYFENFWEPLALPTHLAYRNPDNLHMTSVTAAAGDGFGADTLDVLVALAERDDWVAYPLVHVALYGKGAGWDAHGEDLLARARVQLEELPDDAEPIGPPAGERGVHGWTSWHRYIRPAEQHYEGDTSREAKRFFGGDYLLLHNLAAIAALPEQPTDLGDPDEAPAVCGCAATGGAAPWAWVGLLGLVGARRGRREAARQPRTG